MCSLFLQFFLFWEVIEWKHLICYLWVWFLSLGIMYLRFSHVVACVNNLFFLSPHNSPLYGCTTIYPLNQWKTFRLFPVWGDYRYAAINILKQVFVWNICFHFSRENTNDKHLFYFIRICQSVSRVAVFVLQNVEIPVILHPCQDWVFLPCSLLPSLPSFFSLFLILAIPIGLQ